MTDLDGRSVHAAAQLKQFVINSERTLVANKLIT